MRIFLVLLALLSTSASAMSGAELAAAARGQVGVTIYYDPAYKQLAFPGGDVPIERGVCSDVVIRAYRKHGIDLQELVHRDMAKAFAEYPRKWGLRKTDRNIDHRRVLNLATFFTRHGQSLPVSTQASAYLPGDIVTWMVPHELPHIGIVANQRSAAGTPLIIHNIGAGTQVEDRLFAFRITGHYRFSGLAAGKRAAMTAAAN